MNAGLDTSVVMRLLTGVPEAQAQGALREVQRRIDAGGTVFVSDLVVAEVYFGLQHHYGMPKTVALELLSGFLRARGIESMGAAVAVLATPNLAMANPGFVDRLIHAEYRRHAGEMLTFEKAAGRLPGTRVLAGG
jgi:predicted nucleic-acid-binding protein